MEIRIDNSVKYINPSWDKYLTQASATEDVDRVVVKSVTVPVDTDNNEWIEITQEDVERINKAKNASKGVVEYPEEKINQMIGLLATSINSMELTDEQVLHFKDLYPSWESFIGKSLEAGYKVLYADKLYKVKQKIETVLENQYPSIDTASLYEEINEKNAGTIEDPIPYNNNMALEEGKYYIQNEVIYYCNRSTEIPVYQDLSALVNLYVIKYEA